MSKELYFTDGNNEIKYLDTTASFNLAITQDGSAFDLTNATAIDVKVANDTGYVFDKAIDMATIKQPLAGLITMPVDAEVMNALVPDDYTIEVWVTLSSLVTPGSQEGLTDTGTTTSTTGTTTYNAIFPSDDPQGFTITENVMSDSGDVIPVMSLEDFQQEFDQLKTDLTNKVSTLQGPAGKDGENGKDGATGPQGPQGIQGPKGDTGQGLEIKGKVDTTSQLPTTASEGDGYLVAEELYIWTNNAWKDCGQIQGPAGKDGKDGATGPQGPQGPAGKDGTQVDLSNYATQQQLATKVTDNGNGTIQVNGVSILPLNSIQDASQPYGLDFDKYKDTGNYRFDAVNTVHYPATFSPQYIQLVVFGNHGIDSNANAGAVIQIAIQGNTEAVRNMYTGGTWNAWRTIANTNDVTTAISTATANMVDSTKATNFTAGLQSGGVDVATAADIKSIEDSAWRQLDNKYISVYSGTLSSATTILFRIDQTAKRLYLQGLILAPTVNAVTSVDIDFSSVVKTISPDTRYPISYAGDNPFSTYSATVISNKLRVNTNSSGIALIATRSDSNGAPYVTYDNLV